MGLNVWRGRRKAALNINKGEASMSDITKELTSPELTSPKPVELTDAELDSVAAGAGTTITYTYTVTNTGPSGYEPNAGTYVLYEDVMLPAVQNSRATAVRTG
jgi:uncharacterized repeat protein (TIGR01451 family)